MSDRFTTTVKVTSGPYATVRAWEQAKKLYGDSVSVGGIVGPTFGRYYEYLVEVDASVALVEGTQVGEEPK